MADNRHSGNFRCVILFVVLSTGLTITIPPFTLCGAANFDVWNLTSKIWRFPVPANRCLKPKTSNRTGESCEMTMAFCRSVGMVGTCGQSAVCESYSSVNDTYNLATYQLDSIPFDTAALSSGVGFSTHYVNGETYTKPDNTTCTLNTVMTFYCNVKAVWETGTADILTVPVNPEILFIEEGNFCTYNLTFDFAGACPITIPSEPVSQLSAGSVLLLIFFSTLVVYVVIGGVIKIGMGEQGWNIIPHHDIWALLLLYIMDGIRFTLTCGGHSPRRLTYESI